MLERAAMTLIKGGIQVEFLYTTFEVSGVET